MLENQPSGTTSTTLKNDRPQLMFSSKCDSSDGRTAAPPQLFGLEIHLFLLNQNFLTESQRLDLGVRISQAHLGFIKAASG